MDGETSKTGGSLYSEEVFRFRDILILKITKGNEALSKLFLYLLPVTTFQKSIFTIGDENFELLYIFIPSKC